MDNKDKIEISNVVLQQDLQRLINQMWKLIPMRENNEDWEDHLNILIEEIYGLGEVFKDKLNFVILLSKLEGLHLPSLDFMTYRTVVFKCIALLSRGFNDV